MSQTDTKTKKLSNLFCIVSAIGNDYGLFSYRERLNQLVETIRSVKQRAPGSDIVLYDASEDPLPVDDVNMLRSLVYGLVLLYDDKYVNFLKHKSLDPSPNKFEKKTVGEIQCMNRFLTDLKNNGKRYDRVFKLSGRYQLNEKFDLEDYKDKKGSCVLRPKEDWYGEHVYTLRLWSFDYNNLECIIELFEQMQTHTYKTITETKKLEIIELTFTKYIETLDIPCIVVQTIGLKGMMGLSGVIINE